MNDLEDLQTVLGKVTGEDFHKTAIDDKIDSIKSKLKGDAADWVIDMIENVRQPLKDLTQTNPSSFKSSIDLFRKCALTMGNEGNGPGNRDAPGVTPAHTVSEYVKMTRTTVTGDGTSSGPSWDGAAAAAFNNDFIKHYGPAGQASHSQYWLFSGLELLAEAHQAIYARTRDDVKQMLEAAESGAASLDGLFKSPDGTAKLLVTVAAAVAAVTVSVLATPAVGVPIELAVLAATSSQTAAVIGAVPATVPKPEPFDLKVANPGSLATSMRSAYDKIKSGHDQRKDDVRSTLERLSGYISQPDVRKTITGPKVNGGNDPTVPGPNGTTVIDPKYTEQFRPPAH